MVNSCCRLFLSAVKFVPAEWCPLNTKTPYIINGLLSSVSSKNKEMRLAKNDSVTISATGCASDNGNDHPLCHNFSVSHVKEIQVITCKTSTSRCTSIYNHLHLLNISWRVGCSWRRRYSLYYLNIRNYEFYLLYNFYHCLFSTLNK